jgi:periplasmic divalent cation tolerance protein
MPSKSTERFCVVLTACKGRRVASAIARRLLSDKLAACVQVIPATSFYAWKGRVERAREQVLVIKARRKSFGRIRDAILELHDYELPEIISLGIDQGSSAYLRWLRDSTR